MADWHERLRHPGRTLHNMQWRMRRACGAARRQLLHAPPWVAARNRRETVVDYGPPFIFLEPTNACNLHCPMCPTGTGMARRKAGIMPVDLVRRIAGEIHHKPVQFGLWLAGEPLLHPQIAEIVGIAADAGLRPGIHTNATRLDDELGEQLIRAGLDWISISFDGDNKSDYERLRPPANYDDTIARVRSFLLLRAKLGSATPRVTIQTLIPYRDAQAHPYGVSVEPSAAFRRQFDGCGVDQFTALLAHGWSGQLEGQPGITPAHCHTGTRWVCSVPWRDITIAWNGDCVTCCGDLDGLNVIDNVRDKTIYEAWNGAGYQAFRLAMLSRAIELWPLCGACERIWTEKPHPLDYDLRLEMLRYRLRF